MTIDRDRTRTFVQQAWDNDIVPALTEYIRIPAKSPLYDSRWAEHGHIDRAVSLITDWARRRKIEGLTIEVVRLEGRTPVILMEVPGAVGDTVAVARRITVVAVHPELLVRGDTSKDRIAVRGLLLIRNHRTRCDGGMDARSRPVTGILGAE